MWKSRLFLSLLLLVAVHVQGATLMPIDVATQVDQADLIFSGTVIGVESVPVRDRSFAFTYVTFQVDETLKGAADGPFLTLRFGGGHADGMGYSVSGVPRFAPGGRHVLFVRGNDRLMLPLAGDARGKLDLVAHPVTREPMVVEHRGYVIDGLRDNEWSLSGLKIDALGQFERPERVAEVVAQEGVTVTFDQPVVSEETVPAARVLEELRALIQSRAFAPEFRRVAVVRSASPANVPATAPFASARSKVK